jgi:hypothetical protein
MEKTEKSKMDKLREIAESLGTTVEKLLESNPNIDSIIESYVNSKLKILNE